MNFLQEDQTALSKAAILKTKTNTESRSLIKRLGALDIQRGLIMVLMAIAHSREYIGVDSYYNLHWDNSPAWQSNLWLDFFQQVSVESVVAGGFFMIMGIGIYFLWQSRLKDGIPLNQIWRYLAIRGALMIIIQFTILAFFETISSANFYIYVGVLYGLGFCMILSACCLWLLENLKQSEWGEKQSNMDYWLPLLIAAGIVVINQLLMFQIQLSDIFPGWGKVLLMLGGMYDINGVAFEFEFMPLPWFPAVALGLVLGKIIARRDERSIKQLQWIAFGLLAAWFLLKTAFLHGLLSWGDYKLVVPGEQLDWHAYFCSSKYPPSLTYLLFACGMNVLGISVWFKLENNGLISLLLQPLRVFGQCALFFFVCHWYVYYLLSLCLPARLSSASGILGLWLVGLIILYPMCKWYRNFKMTKPKESLWRMF